MRYYCLFILILCTFLGGCGPSPQNTAIEQINFYHWKTNVSFSQPVRDALQQADSKTIYLRYFDVDAKAQPVGPIREVHDSIKKYEIIPVVFMVNGVFKRKGLNIKELADNMAKLIHQIHQKHFGKKPLKIQIDCDWSQSTRANYFEFLEYLQQTFDISVTIRLHQIKYPDKTGVPPVKNGTLMLYNVGDLDKMDQNSILDPEIVQQYIHSKTTYPLTLNVALPLFSQMVIRNLEGKIRLVNHAYVEDLEQHPAHFKKENTQLYKVVKDTLYKGLYLFDGYEIKIEKLDVPTIIDSYNMVKNSGLSHSEIIFYHLDSTTLNSIPFNSLIQQL